MTSGCRYVVAGTCTSFCLSEQGATEQLRVWPLAGRANSLATLYFISPVSFSSS